MKDSKLIALSAVATALSVVIMVLGAFVDIFEYSALFCASLCTMLPLAKKSVKGGVLTGLATAVLCAIFTVAIKPAMVVFYALFFGLHPTVNYIIREKKFNRIIGAILKAVWFVGALLLVYTFFSSFLTEGTILEREDVKKYVYLILTVGGALLFILYDLLMTRFQKFVDMTIARLNL